ncbi:uncharacterized protein LOC18442860 [Amborella trichopoda]|uniref:WW domain-containing protein n=1 Tax=Amborella trichopoda TaxID=13333 RepID=U5CWS9_AMBTC|nr:uncharacterized protein LOC18442860 [Amborella trichopoda]ERN14599.1 hypothetical protein AMTR_s00038p00161690 [Amborella trichopoda]|eukprot:XP_006853132.1 uncharacterized protein LOC18442860 [Amborella trichopoda]
MVSFPMQSSGDHEKRELEKNTASINNNKRRWDDLELQLEHKATPIDVELHLERPLPREWQQCLDLQSGEIHFYNIRTQKRTWKDPREAPHPSMRLDLELNLTLPENDGDHLKRPKTDDPKHFPATEMVATPCFRCHMLVVLCKSSPTCPNCKFLHPLEQKKEPNLPFRQTMSLLCCED